MSSVVTLRKLHVTCLSGIAQEPAAGEHIFYLVSCVYFNSVFWVYLLYQNKQNFPIRPKDHDIVLFNTHLFLDSDALWRVCVPVCLLHRMLCSCLYRVHYIWVRQWCHVVYCNSVIYRKWNWMRQCVNSLIVRLCVYFACEISPKVLDVLPVLATFNVSIISPVTPKVFPACKICDRQNLK
jgi:hypothetical protein